MFVLSVIALVFAYFVGYGIQKYYVILVSKTKGIINKLAKDMQEEEMHQLLEQDFLLKGAGLRLNGFPAWYNNGAHVSFPYVKFTEEATLRSCKRCKGKFHIGTKGNPPVCRYHPKGKKKIDGTSTKIHICCDKEYPCKQIIGHVPFEIPSGELGKFVRSPVQNGLTDSRSHKIYALDCEMVYTEHGLSIARLTVVDFKGQVVMNDIIRPIGEILDYNTEFSGISLQTFFSAELVYTLEESRARLFDLVNEKSILIGHGLQNDFIALRLVHRRVVDTSVLYPDPRNKNNTRQAHRFVLSLKELSRNHLSKNIQQHSALGHCSEEDAVTALELVMQKIDSSRSSIKI